MRLRNHGELPPCTRQSLSKSFLSQITKQNTMEILTMRPVLASIVFSIIGIAILLITYFIIEKLTPENTWSQISKNNNVALAIVFGAFIIGISMIISAAIHG